MSRRGLVMIGVLTVALFVVGLWFQHAFERTQADARHARADARAAALRAERAEAANDVLRYVAGLNTAAIEALRAQLAAADQTPVAGPPATVPPTSPPATTPAAPPQGCTFLGLPVPCV